MYDRLEEDGQMNGLDGYCTSACITVCIHDLYVYNILYIRMMMSLQYLRKETFFLYFVLIWKLS